MGPALIPTRKGRTILHQVQLRETFRWQRLAFLGLMFTGPSRADDPVLPAQAAFVERSGTPFDAALARADRFRSTLSPRRLVTSR